MSTYLKKHSESCKGANIFECISTRTERTHQVYVMNSSLLSDVLAWSSLVLVGSWSGLAQYIPALTAHCSRLELHGCDVGSSCIPFGLLCCPAFCFVYLFLSGFMVV